MKNKKTIVLGASTKPERYSHIAVNRLVHFGYEAVPMGIKKGEIQGIEIINDLPQMKNIHTITLYLNPTHQKNYYDYILSLKPKRIIFNPGTENPELINLAEKNKIETTIACTLVLLSTGQY